MVPHAIPIGVGITVATIAALVAGFFRCRRQQPFPVHGWLGLFALAGAEWLLFRKVEPVATYFTPIVWSAYILIADAAVLALTNRSRLHDAPIVMVRMAFLSIPLWLIFEAYNFRLQNWTYDGVPREWPAALLGYGWSFATITPALFETSDLVQALLPPLPAEPWTISRTAENALIACGAICLIVPLVVPQRIAAYLFVLLWLGFLLVLDPVNRRLGLPSFLGDLSDGFRRRLYGFLLSGWICGWLWEFWNNWAAAKWHYTFPMFQRTKIFEMPAPGYLGFLPFALECFTMYVTAAWLAGWLKRVK
ncbi:MAG TPA: hypothetical protein VNM68_12620 [Candidatus Polarisedimenticolia bacterium]|nr:hypothetical protein [Candidatus Polarisedimenticolia bacterium]